MKTRNLFLIGILIALAFSACKDKEVSSNRNVKYEITGSFTGPLTVIYNDNVSGNTTVTVTSLPWSKEILYGKNVIGIGLGAQSAGAGSVGQTVTLKIYAGNRLVKSSPTATANAAGSVNPEALAYVFL